MTDERAIHELYDLLHSLIEQELTAEQLARLEQLVSSDPHLRRRYLIYLQWHALAERYGVDAPAPSDLASSAPLPDPGATSPPSLGETAPPWITLDRSIPPPPHGLFPLGGWLGLASVGVFLSLLIATGVWWQANRKMSDKPSLANTQPPAVAAPATAFVATLVSSVDCLWDQPSLAVAAASRLPSGWLRLLGGVAEIRFDCGATVLLQGPAEFALDAPARGTLRSGRLVSRGDTDVGFTILTSNTEVVDLGTEFGVVADQNGGTEVHVFDGAVRVRQRGVLSGAVPERVLQAGQATRFESNPFDAAVDAANRLDGPMGIAFGPDGNLYVASRFTDTVLRYDGRTGTPDDLFVKPRAGELNSPFFLAFHADGKLLVSSTGNHAVLRFDGHSGRFLDAFVPPRGGGMAGPMGLAFGSDGHLYVAGSGKQAVFRYHGTTGEPLGTLVASEAGGLSGPTGIAFGPDGHLWVVDRNRDCVMRFDGHSGEPLEQLDFGGELKFPFGIAFSPAGQMFVASKGSHQFLRYDPDQPDAGWESFQGPSFPHAVAFGPDGRLYVSSDSTNAVMRYDETTGKFIDTFVAGWQEVPVDREHFVRQMPDRVQLHTGLNRAGQQLRPGEHCPRWFVARSPDDRFIAPGPAVVTEALSGWSPNSQTSSWLSVLPLRDGFSVAPGEYTFFVGIEVHAHDLEQATIEGALWASGEVVQVRFNEQPLSSQISGDPAGVTKAIFVDRGFIPGLNYLHVVVRSHDEQPVALRSELELIRGHSPTELPSVP